MGAVKETTKSLYDSDFAAWAFDQAEAVKRKDWRAIDVPNLVEELQSRGRQQRAELRNRLAVLLAHLAKWQTQPLHRDVHGPSWLATIATQRDEIADHLGDNPSLKPYIDEAMVRAWTRARLSAARKSGLAVETFAEACPYTWEQAIDPDRLPR